MALNWVHHVLALLCLGSVGSALILEPFDLQPSCDDEYGEFETLLLSDGSGLSKPMFIRNGPPILVREISMNTVACPDYAALATNNFSVNFMDENDLVLKNTFKVLAKNPVVFKRTLLGNYDLVINFGDNPQLTRTLQLESSIQSQCKPDVIVRGCRPREEFCAPRCENGGQCIGFNRCSCPPGHDGDVCQTSFAKPRSFNMSFGEAQGLTVVSNDGKFTFQLDGAIKYVESTSFRRSVRAGPHGGPHGHAGHHGSFHVYHQGGTAHCHHHGHDCNDIFHKDPHGAFTSRCNFIFGHNHHGHTHLFSTQPTPGHLGASLVHGPNSLSLNVNTGHVQCNLNVPHGMHHGHSYNVVSSFSPHFGCSLYVNGHHIGSSAPSQPPVSQTPQAPQSFCMGHCTTHFIPNALFNASISNPMFVAGSLQNMVINGVASLIGGVLGALFNPYHTATTAQPMTTTRPATARPATAQPAVTARTSPAPTTTKTTTLPPLISSPICYDCGPMKTDGQCKSVKMCPTGEICLVFEDHGNYTHSCLERSTCLTAGKTVTSGCWHCCTGYLCNERCPGSCKDTPVCASVQRTGYKVCQDQSFAQKNCQKTCNLCAASG